MASFLDLYRTAHLLIEQYGVEEASLIAARRSDALLALGDIDGQRVWKGVLRALEELARGERRMGEHIN